MNLAAIPASSSGQLRVGQFNVENFFDTVDDPRTHDTVVTPKQYETKLEKLSLAIRTQLGSPDVIGLEEVENQSVLNDLVARPEMQALGYKPIILDGNDSRGIHVAMLYRTGTITINGASEPNPPAQLPDPGDENDPGKLFARAPLVVDATWHGRDGAAAGAQQLTFMINHFKSRMGGPQYNARREAQGAFIGGLVDAKLAADPASRVLVLGDLNAGPAERAVQLITDRADGTARMTSTTASLPKADQYSWGTSPSKRVQFDHVLASASMNSALVGAKILHFDTGAAKQSSNDASTPAGVSDHDPIVATFDMTKLAR